MRGGSLGGKRGKSGISYRNGGSLPRKANESGEVTGSAKRGAQGPRGGIGGKPPLEERKISQKKGGSKRGLLETGLEETGTP